MAAQRGLQAEQRKQMPGEALHGLCAAAFANGHWMKTELLSSAAFQDCPTDSL
jgi:hypothetical protein